MRRSAPLELIIESRRDTLFAAAAPGRRTRRAAVDDNGIGTIVAVGRETSPTGTDIVVRVAMVDRQGGIKVPGELLVQLVLPGERVHVGGVSRRQRIVVVLAARIARRLKGVRPAGAHDVLRTDLLRHREPRAVSLPLVLEFQCRGKFARHTLPPVSY